MTADTSYNGLALPEWAVILLAFILLIGFFWIMNLFLFFGFIALIVVEMIVHFFG